MEKQTSGKTGREVTRRDFIKTSAAVSLAAMLPGIPKSGPIALQHHGDHVQFANIYIKELD